MAVPLLESPAIPVFVGPISSSQEDQPRHAQVTVDRRARMRLNGESVQQMAHADAIKAAGGVSLDPNDGSDTSVDQRWEYDDTPSGLSKDKYVLITTFIWLGIKITLLAIPMLLLHFPPMLVARLYISIVPDGTERIRRSRAFYAIALGCFFLSIPAVLLILLSYGLDCLAYWGFGLLYCVCTCRPWSQVQSSMRKIDPYRNGPSVVRHATDFFVCVMGQCGRQSLFETHYMVAVMWLLMPWLKYYVCCNPWIYDLESRLVQQISTEMQDLGTPSEVADTSRKIISQARQARTDANNLDIWSFVPHYPYPPPDRRWALGLQAGGSKYPGKFTLIVHTTHAISEARGCTEQFVLSNSCEQPIYRVMLWYNNPFHFLTGWVEASISTGAPSQPNKYHGGEHPMWLVTARTPQVSGRDSWTGSGMIDAFFDYWLPVFVHEMRRLTYAGRFRDRGEPNEQLAMNIADAKYQEVHSEDGYSRPRTFVGRQDYDARDVLTQFHRDADEQKTYSLQHVANVLSTLGNTTVGQRITRRLQGDDLHDAGAPLARVQEAEFAVESRLEATRETIEAKIGEVQERFGDGKEKGGVLVGMQQVLNSGNRGSGSSRRERTLTLTVDTFSAHITEEGTVAVDLNVDDEKSVGTFPFTRVQFHKDGVPLMYGEVLTRLASSAADGKSLRSLYAKVLGGDGDFIPFQVYFWECKPVSQEKLASIVYEFVAIDAEGLQGTPTDPTAFDDKFDGHRCSLDVIEFMTPAHLPNQSNLLVPVGPVGAPPAELSMYRSIGQFFKYAPAEQADAMLQKLGTLIPERMKARENPSLPLWASTTGGRIAWVHVRLDNAPTYYRFQEYKDAMAAP